MPNSAVAVKSAATSKELAAGLPKVCSDQRLAAESDIQKPEDIKFETANKIIIILPFGLLLWRSTQTNKSHLDWMLKSVWLLLRTVTLIEIFNGSYCTGNYPGVRSFS